MNRTHERYMVKLEAENLRLAYINKQLTDAVKRAYAVMCVEGENDLEEWSSVLTEMETAIAASEESARTTVAETTAEE